MGELRVIRPEETESVVLSPSRWLVWLSKDKVLSGWVYFRMVRVLSEGSEPQVIMVPLTNQPMLSLPPLESVDNVWICVCENSPDWNDPDTFWLTLDTVWYFQRWWE